METNEEIRAKPARGRWMFWVGLIMVIGTAIYWVQQSKIFHTYRIAFITAGVDPYWDQVMSGAQAAATVTGVKLTVIQPHSMKEQMADLHAAMSDHYDGVAVSPSDAEKELNDLDTAAAGSTLVTFDTDCPLSNRLCFIGSDNYEAGRTCADLVKQAIPDGGSIIICGPTLAKHSADRRRQGLIDSLLDRQINENRLTDAVDAELKGPKYSIVTTLLDDSDPSTAAKLATDALNAHPEVKCFVGLTAYNVPALIGAVKPAVDSGKVKIVGFDVDPRTLSGIDDGTVFGTIRQHQYECGYETVRLLSGALQGDRSTAVPIYPVVRLEVDAVTKANLHTATSSPSARQG